MVGEQNRVGSLPTLNACLSLDQVLAATWPVCSAERQPAEARGPFGVEAGEVAVAGAASQILAAQMQRFGAHRVGRRRQAIAAPPAQGSDLELDSVIGAAMRHTVSRCPRNAAMIARASASPRPANRKSRSRSQVRRERR